jgi:hypothetical protein
VSRHLGELTRYAHLWLPGYLLDSWRRRGQPRPDHAWFTIADHFEPLWKGPDAAVARERVALWRRRWPEIAENHRDSGGRAPRYTFFYPQEEYREELLAPLAEMTAAGIADVEVHIHHDGEGAQVFVDRMGGFLEALRERHGLLRSWNGHTAFGFIHGNWALDNARPDGRWCGLNNELTLLRELGCYADFTLPAVPNPSQAGPVNTIYRAVDDPLRPRSHARGFPVLPGTDAVGDLTLIPGPLALQWRTDRPWRPRIDTGEIAGYAPPSRERARLWLARAPRLAGHAFIKVFTHGAQERNSSLLLAGGLDRLFEAMSEECAQEGTTLHFVSAWEMWRVVEALRQRSDPLAVLQREHPRTVSATPA